MKISLPAILFLLSLTGCNAMTASDKTGHAGDDPVYRKNPHPTQAYRITMTIEDAPGPFGHVSGTAFYDMTNHEQCTPLNNPFEGVHTKPSEAGIPMLFRKIDEAKYEGTIYADGMIDADYYGQGVCRFELTSIGVTLMATGKYEETRFQPALLKDQIEGEATTTTYFWKGRYPKEDMSNFPDSGTSNVDDFNENARPNIFKVILHSEKISHEHDH